MHAVASEDTSCLSVLPVLCRVDDLAPLSFLVIHRLRLGFAASPPWFRCNCFLPHSSNIASFPFPEPGVDGVVERVAVSSPTPGRGAEDGFRESKQPCDVV